VHSTRLKQQETIETMCAYIFMGGWLAQSLLLVFNSSLLASRGEYLLMTAVLDKNGSLQRREFIC